MNVTLQQRIVGGTAAVALAFSLVHTAPSQVPVTLPVIEKPTQAAYSEKITDKVAFDMLPIPAART